MGFSEPTERRLAFNQIWNASNPEIAYNIYLLRDEHGFPIYVGQTTNLRKRTFDHYAYKEWGSEIATVEVLEVVQGPANALARESHYINLIRPRYNKTAQKEAEPVIPIYFENEKYADR